MIILCYVDYIWLFILKDSHISYSQYDSFIMWVYELIVP